MNAESSADFHIPPELSDRINNFRFVRKVSVCWRNPWYKRWSPLGDLWTDALPTHAEDERAAQDKQPFLPKDLTPEIEQLPFHFQNTSPYGLIESSGLYCGGNSQQEMELLQENFVRNRGLSDTKPIVASGDSCLLLLNTYKYQLSVLKATGNMLT